MFTPFGRRLALLAAFELSLAAIVIWGAFLVVVLPVFQPALDSHPVRALTAQLIFASCLLLPAGALGIHRFDCAEALHSFLQKFIVSIGLGLLLAYLAF